jgi:hypothetical protein
MHHVAGPATWHLAHGVDIVIVLLVDEVLLVDMLRAHNAADAIDHSIRVLHLHLLRRNMPAVVHVRSLTHEVVDKQGLQLVAMLYALVLAAEMRPLLILAHLVHHAEATQMVLEHQGIVAVIQVHRRDLLPGNQRPRRLITHLVPIAGVT